MRSPLRGWLHADVSDTYFLPERCCSKKCRALESSPASQGGTFSAIDDVPARSGAHSRPNCEGTRGVKLSHFAEALRCCRIYDDVVNISQGRAPLGKCSMKFTFGDRCDISDDCP